MKPRRDDLAQVITDVETDLTDVLTRVRHLVELTQRAGETATASRPLDPAVLSTALLLIGQQVEMLIECDLSCSMDLIRRTSGLEVRT